MVTYDSFKYLIPWQFESNSSLQQQQSISGCDRLIARQYSEGNVIVPWHLVVKYKPNISFMKLTKRDINVLFIFQIQTTQTSLVRFYQRHCLFFPPHLIIQNDWTRRKLYKWKREGGGLVCIFSYDVTRFEVCVGVLKLLLWPCDKGHDIMRYVKYIY